MRKWLIGSVLWCFSLMAWGNSCNELLRDDRPESYTATSNDTPWDIFDIFLKNYWLWSEACGVNHPISNYNDIHPGDVIKLTQVDNKPQLMVIRKTWPFDERKTIKLSPDSQSHSLTSVTPLIPLNKISEFFNNSQILNSPEVLDKAPYVIGGKAGRLMSTLGNIIYARGVLKDTVNVGVYRKQDIFVDPETKEVLGVIALDVGSATLKHVNGSFLTLNITRSSEEILRGDRLLLIEKQRQPSSLTPSTLPQKNLQARIIHIVKGTNKIGKFDNVIINKGERENIKPGYIMAIYVNTQIHDTFTNETLSLPSDKIGLLMVYRTFEKLSYGIVLQAKQPITLGLLLKAP
ncbi:MAG: peptidoglycan-binding protein [Endozoicomonadaceae bacterium]|nr:peptidoglycan-binding protein [Endozoicomonadaceae bacterium]